MENGSGHELQQEVTALLLQWNDGNKEVVDHLMPLVNRELRRLAGAYLRKERPEHTLQPTALVNELYFRLVDRKQVGWRSRAQFFAFASHTMRRILVDHARGRDRVKRGSGACKLALEDVDDPATPGLDVDLIALDAALDELAAMDEQLAQVVELRFFAGLTTREIGSVMGTSAASVSRQWQIARGWLYKQLRDYGE